VRDKVREIAAGGDLRLLLIGVAALSAATLPALAQDGFDDDQWPNGDVDPPELTLEELAETVDAGREMVAAQIDGIAALIDSFFDDDRLEDEDAEGRLRLGTTYFLEAGEAPSLKADVGFSLSLPNTEQRLRLVVTGAFQRDDDGREIIERRRRPSGRDDDEESSIAADLRYVLLEDLQQNLDARVGLRVRGFVPAGRVGLRYRRSWNPNDWTVRMTHEAEWETINGFSAESFLDLETQLARDFFFRVTPEIDWEEDDPGYDYGLGFTLTHRLGEQRALQYSLDYSFSSEPSHGLDQILLSARYRQTIFRDWVFGEIAPQIRIADRDGASGTPGVTFRVQAVF
jgi:hypothetical protein